MDLHYKISGQGEPLVILHGLFGTSDNWASMARILARHHTVILTDLRNHGRSPHHPEMSYPQMVEDVVRVLEKEWIHRTHILGHSMGGKVAMHMALEHPDLVEKLLVADIGIKPYPGGHEHIFEALEQLPVTELRDRNEAESLLRESLHDEAVVRFLLKNLAREGEGFRWKMNLEAIRQHYPRILAGIPVTKSFDKPVRFVRGGRSGYIGQDDWPSIREVFPAADLVTLPDAGHWVHAEDPEGFVRAALPFFAGQ